MGIHINQTHIRGILGGGVARNAPKTSPARVSIKLTLLFPYGNDRTCWFPVLISEKVQTDRRKKRSL